ncbi:MAG: Spy/CpxP family protein refolding chaperone [Marinomonas atlantica]|nr:Spy/CpxP family protein refolding chaperone [Marinomonas atlantica]
MTISAKKAGKLGVVGLAVAMAASVATTSFAGEAMQAAPNAVKPYSEQMVQRMSTQLKFDDETKADVSELFAEAREEHQELLDDMRAFSSPVKMLSPKDDGYVDQIEELAEKRSELMVRMDVQQAEIRHEFYELLSDEQIAMLEAKKQAGS